MTKKKRKFEFTGNRLTRYFYIPIFLTFRLIGACFVRREDQADSIQTKS